MGPKAPTAAEAIRRQRRKVAALKASLRDVGNQLGLLNRHVGAHVELKDADFACLDLISRNGPLSPRDVARRAGLHPATLTGVLDRLERGGWVVRERNTAGPDRRSVQVRRLPDRNAELFRLYSEMNGMMEAICADYSEAELELITIFLQRTAEAGRHAAGSLADQHQQ